MSFGFQREVRLDHLGTVGISRIKFSSFWHRISKILKNCIFHWNRIYDAMQAFTYILVSILSSILPDFARFRPILPYILWFYWFFKILLCNIDLITISDRLFFSLMSDFVRFLSDFCPILSNFDQFWPIIDVIIDVIRTNIHLKQGRIFFL